MTVLSLVTANKVNVVESLQQLTLPAAEAITAGNAVRIDTNGKFTKANATAAAEVDAWGVAVKTVAAGEAVTAIHRGVLDGFDVSALAYNAAVFLSDTDGALDTAMGTIEQRVGRIIPAVEITLGTAHDKLLEVDFGQGAGGGGAGIEQRNVVQTELLAASVDKWVFVADRAYEVVAVREIHSVAGGASAAVRPRKVTAAGTDAPGATAGATVKELTAAAIDLTATANTAQSPALVGTAADLQLAAGDKIGLDFSGTLTGLVGWLGIVLEPR